MYIRTSFVCSSLRVSSIRIYILITGFVDPKCNTYSCDIWCRVWVGDATFIKYIHFTVYIQSITLSRITWFRACVHVPSPCPSLTPSKFNIVPMVTVRLMGRMDTEPILSIKRSVSIGTVVNFDGVRDGTCKQALRYFGISLEILSCVCTELRYPRHDVKTVQYVVIRSGWCSV